MSVGERETVGGLWRGPTIGRGVMGRTEGMPIFGVLQAGAVAENNGSGLPKGELSPVSDDEHGDEVPKDETECVTSSHISSHSLAETSHISGTGKNGVPSNLVNFVQNFGQNFAKNVSLSYSSSSFQNTQAGEICMKNSQMLSSDIREMYKADVINLFSSHVSPYYSATNGTEPSNLSGLGIASSRSLSSEIFPSPSFSSSMFSSAVFSSPNTFCSASFSCSPFIQSIYPGSAYPAPTMFAVTSQSSSVFPTSAFTIHGLSNMADMSSAVSQRAAASTTGFTSTDFSGIKNSAGMSGIWRPINWLSTPSIFVSAPEGTTGSLQCIGSEATWNRYCSEVAQEWLNAHPEVRGQHDAFPEFKIRHQLATLQTTQPAIDAASEFMSQFMNPPGPLFQMMAEEYCRNESSMHCLGIFYLFNHLIQNYQSQSINQNYRGRSAEPSVADIGYNRFIVNVAPKISQQADNRKYMRCVKIWQDRGIFSRTICEKLRFIFSHAANLYVSSSGDIVASNPNLGKSLGPLYPLSIVLEMPSIAKACKNAQSTLPTIKAPDQRLSAQLLSETSGNILETASSRFDRASRLTGQEIILLQSVLMDLGALVEDNNNAIINIRKIFESNNYKQSS